MDKEQILIEAVNKLTQLVQSVENMLEDVKFSRKLILKEANEAIGKLQETEQEAPVMEAPVEAAPTKKTK